MFSKPLYNLLSINRILDSKSMPERSSSWSEVVSYLASLMRHSRIFGTWHPFLSSFVKRSKNLARTS